MEPAAPKAGLRDAGAPRPVAVDATPEGGDAVVDRLEFLRERDDPRFNVYRSLYAGYEPPPYAMLRDEEIDILRQWYDEILALGLRGETGPALVGVMQTFIAVSGLSHVVQLGHWAGYSTLMLGFSLRRMGRRRALFTADINAKVSDITRRWVERAGLADVVHVQCGDSASPDTARAALEYLGARPEVVLIDSSHQYAHTITELDQWYGELVPGGLLFMHDVSDFAAQFDVTREGGVRRALHDWIGGKGAECLRLNHLMPELNARLGYIDGCGLAILQKPYRAHDDKLGEFAAQCVALREHWPQHDQPPWSRLTGSLEAMLIGIRATPVGDSQDVGVRFTPNDRVRISLAYHAASPLGPLVVELVVPGPAEPLFKQHTTEPFAFEAGMNHLEVELDWPDLAPGRRPLSISLRRASPCGEGDDVICDVDRGILMFWLPATPPVGEPTPADPELRFVSVSGDLATPST